VANLDGNVSVIDTENDTVTNSVQVGSSPWGVAVTPDGTKVYVTNAGSDNVSVIDTATDNVIATVKVGSFPVALGQFIGGKILLPVNPTIDVVSLQVVSNNSEDNGGTSSGSGGGGGGSGSISPEPQSNVEAKELSQTFIVNGSSINFNFLQNATPIINLSFDSKKTAGKTTAIVEMLKNKSSLVS
jgi:YVTN family beta-propeller protein